MAEGITASCGAARRPPRLPAALERFGGDFTLYSSAATSLGLTVRYTENRRSDHDEWSNGTNGNAIIHQGTVAAVNLYIASQAAALASPSMTSSTRFLEGGRVPSDPEIAQPPPPLQLELQLSLCCRCTRQEGGAGDDCDGARAAARARGCAGAGNARCAQKPNVDAVHIETPDTTPPVKPEANATAAPEALRYISKLLIKGISAHVESAIP